MKECLRTCPRIQECLSNIESDNAWASIGQGFRSDNFMPFEETNVGELLFSAECTYDCTTGPIERTVEVKTGLFRKRTERVSKYICGLESES